MTRTNVIFIVIGACAVLGFAAFVGLILVPAWTAYSRLWERLVATVLSLYIAGVMVAIGVGLGGYVIPKLWDQLHP
ncbi:MAG: hypothetical protein ABSG64_01875 [Solirubrobacteraceae bacterium]